MLRFSFVGLFVFALCLGFAAGGEVKGKITKIDDKGVTMLATGATDAKTLTFAKDCKFCKQVKKVKEEIKDGLKADEFKNITKKGLFAILTTNDKNEVTEVLLSKKKKVQ